ncbi:MAG: GspE/PulE family protein [Candidatus Moraniibacteriota bacterium]
MVQIVHQDPASSQEKAEQTAEALGKMRAESIEKEAAAFAGRIGLPYIDFHVFPVDAETLFLVPEKDARALNLVVFHKKDTAYLFATTTPEQEEVLRFIADFSSDHGTQSELYVISDASLEHALAQYAQKRTLLDNLDLVRVSLGDSDLERFEKNFGELITLHKDHPLDTSKAVEIILAGAKKLKASDIHLEPEETVVRLRYRIDGVLQNIGDLPNEIYRLILSRIKMIGKMRLNVRKEAQDGHFFITIEEKRIDVRVNIIPGKHGESINMRLLSGEDIVADIDSLGLQGSARDIVLHEIERPNGMILNTGPTGSGKTTTLYTLLHHINKPGAKIITVEDPIEYSLPGIVQTEVSKDKSYTFATALRAVVRQDPDVILVGEIRDNETADISVNAALTGHLVLSTLHSNSAPASIPRLLELGVRPSLIASSINLLIAQRLVRSLCPDCKTSYIPAEETTSFIIRYISIISPKAKISLPKEMSLLWKAVGCIACNFSGYQGRVGIFEVLPMTTGIKEIVNKMGTEQDIFKAALENGMVTMTQDGILKALQGITTMEEVLRVTDQGDILQNLYDELMPNELSRATFITDTLFSETTAHLASLSEFETYTLQTDSKARLQIIFAAATALKASDVHIEPNGETFDVRFRLDGILKTAVHFPLNEYPGFLSEIKLLAGLKSSERAGITDSRFSIRFENPAQAGGNESIDIRLSIILGGFGETVVMRLLNKSVIKLDLEALNIREESLNRILTAIQKPSGMILNTGPTESGKTTTLYSILSRMNKPEVKIITVEDPIEYQLPGLLQTQINEKEGYTFSTALRSLLRQNPNIIMIGEIRDDETAQIAVQAASTGHLVLSTLHTNSAAATVQRLAKMGVSGIDLADASNLFIAQRLVRRLCKNCATETIPTETEMATIQKVLASLSKKSSVLPPKTLRLFKEKGCSLCNGTGYTGQMIISETLEVDQDIRDLIASGALAHEIEAKAIEKGMLTILQDGILAALEGKTTFEEIERVTEI